MASLAELVKGFRANVRAGIPSNLQFDGKRIYLNIGDQEHIDNRKGYVGIGTAPKPEGTRCWPEKCVHATRSGHCKLGLWPTHANCIFQ